MKKQRITIQDFIPVIPWEQIKLVMGKKDFNKFTSWMVGKTIPVGGVYHWDLMIYLNQNRLFKKWA